VRLAALGPSAPRDPKDLAARITVLESLLSGRTKANNRYELGKSDEAASWNALGIAWLKVPDGERAGQCFNRAIGAKPLFDYRLNKALAIRLEAPKPNENPESAQRRLDVQCSREIMAEITRVEPEKESEERKTRYRELMITGLALGFNASPTGFDYSSALQGARTKLGLDDAEYFRDMGACQDTLRATTQAIGNYKQAIDLGHWDRGLMQRRIDLFERRR
jgi:hypothetical protein